MTYILILIMCIFASAKVCFREAFNKKSSKNSIDIWCFNIFAFMLPALVFMPEVFGMRPIVLVYAAITAMFMLLCHFFYTRALSHGDEPKTIMVINFAVVINAAVSFFYFHEPVSTMRFMGIALATVAFVISGGITGKIPGTKWLVSSILSMVAFSGTAIVQKLFGASPYSEENLAFVSCLYAISAIISAVIYFFLKKKEKLSYKIDFVMIRYVIGVGVCLAVFQIIYTFILARLDGTFFFPVQTGMTTILSVIAGILIFKDKFTKRQLIGAVLSFISIILVSY